MFLMIQTQTVIDKWKYSSNAAKEINISTMNKVVIAIGIYYRKAIQPKLKHIFYFSFKKRVYFFLKHEII